MTIATATLSGTGHIVIPKTIRDQLHWETGHELIIETSESGVLLKAKPAEKNCGSKTCADSSKRMARLYLSRNSVSPSNTRTLTDIEE